MSKQWVSPRVVDTKRVCPSGCRQRCPSRSSAAGTASSPRTTPWLDPRHLVPAWWRAPTTRREKRSPRLPTSGHTASRRWPPRRQGHGVGPGRRRGRPSPCRRRRSAGRGGSAKAMGQPGTGDANRRTAGSGSRSCCCCCPPTPSWSSASSLWMLYPPFQSSSARYRCCFRHGLPPTCSSSRRRRLEEEAASIETNKESVSDLGFPCEQSRRFYRGDRWLAESDNRLIFESGPTSIYSFFFQTI